MQWSAKFLMAVLNFLVRPKISEREALAIVEVAAAEKGSHVELREVDRHMGLYEGIAFIVGTEIMVLCMVDGRSSELVQLDRSDELDEDAP